MVREVLHWNRLSKAGCTPALRYAISETSHPKEKKMVRVVDYIRSAETLIIALKISSLLRNRLSIFIENY